MTANTRVRLINKMYNRKEQDHYLLQFYSQPYDNNLKVCFVLQINRSTSILSASGRSDTKSRSKRYLLTPINTQWGVFATVSVPLHPETTTSVAWFFEANYYTVANSSYFDPLLGDIVTTRDRQKRSETQPRIVTRAILYRFIESMLERHGYPGRACLLKAVCESSQTHFLHNGLLGDLLHVILTPSTSELEEDIEDCFYEAEYLGEEEGCACYTEDCPDSPLEVISVQFDSIL